MSTLKDTILESCRNHYEDIVAIRRDIHQHPELGFDLPRTSNLVAEELQRLGIETRTGIGQSGVVGDITVPGANRRIAIRADMDALPMQEESNVPFKSIYPGRAHMCGHDAHTAMLLGAARVISEQRDHLTVNVRFIFQPSEEDPPGGAPAMIADGVLEGVDEIFGQHLWPLFNTGEYGICHGPAFAQPDIFRVSIFGKGGHAAHPNWAIDPITTAAEVVLAWQTIVSRTINPFDAVVVSVTRIQAGSTHNVIPERVDLEGTIRTFLPEVQKVARGRFEEILKGITAAHRTRYQLDYTEVYPATYNHPASAQKAEAILQQIVGHERVHRSEPSTGAEDFGYYTQKIPGCFIFLGMRNESKGLTQALHDTRFELDEEAMIYGMALHAGMVLFAQ